MCRCAGPSLSTTERSVACRPLRAVYRIAGLAAFHPRACQPATSPAGATTIRCVNKYTTGAQLGWK